MMLFKVNSVVVVVVVWLWCHSSGCVDEMLREYTPRRCRLGSADCVCVVCVCLTLDSTTTRTSTCI